MGSEEISNLGELRESEGSDNLFANIHVCLHNVIWFSAHFSYHIGKIIAHYALFVQKNPTSVCL